MAIIFEDMRSQVPAIFPVDDGASGCAGVALVGDDQFQRMAEQFDMLVIDRGHAGGERADQAYRIVAAADAGLEHREIAFALLKIQAGQREHRLKGPEFLIMSLRKLGDSGFDAQLQARQGVVANRYAINLKAFVEVVQMRRGKQSGSQAIGVGDAGAERRGAAFAVRSRHHHRHAPQPCAIHRDGVEQVGHPRQTDAVTIFRKIEQLCASPLRQFCGNFNSMAPANPWRKMCDARFLKSNRCARIAPAAGSTGSNSPRSPVSHPDRRRCP